MFEALRLGTILATALLAEPGPPVVTLDEALASLDARSLAIIQVRARADEASAVASQAAAPLLPTLSATGGYTRNSADRMVQFPPSMGGQELTLQPMEQLTAAGTLRVPILNPGGWWELSAAVDAARAAGGTADAARLQVRTGFVQAAHLAAAAEEVVVAGERAVESAAEFDRSAARRVAAGTAPPLDSLRAQTERVKRESDLAKARADLGRAQLGLGVLLGRDGPVRVLVTPAEPGVPDPAPLVEAALDRRPELASALAQAGAAEARVSAAWASLAPQLSGTVSAFASDVPYVTGDKQGWRASLDLTWAIYDGGLRYGRRRQASAQLAGARAAAEGTRLQILQEVQDGARDVAVASERLRLAEQQRKLAADASASARRSFEAGVASSLDVVDANDRLYQSDVGLADARARLGVARAALRRAAGEG